MSKSIAIKLFSTLDEPITLFDVFPTNISSPTDVTASLTAKDETIMKMSKSTEEREKLLRTQLSDLQAKSKHRIADLTSQVEQLQSEVARRMMETEGLTESLSALTRTNNENKVKIENKVIDHA